MADTFTLYKLIILYLLDKVNFPMSNAQLSEFILEKEYTDYFTVQTALSELSETGFLRVKTVRNTSLYRITPAGRDTLEYFGDKVSDTICMEIQTYLKEKEVEIQDSLSTTADYFPAPHSGYLARCQVRERSSTLIDLTISVPSEDQAQAVCAHWKERSQEIYAYIMQNLL